MNKELNYKNLFYRARAVARLEGREKMTFWDIITAAISMENEWLDNNYSIKKITGIAYNETIELKELIVKIKDFKEPEEEIRKSIHFDNKKLIGKLENYVKSHENLKDEDLLKNLIKMSAEIAIEHYPAVPAYIHFEDLHPLTVKKLKNLNIFLSEQQEFVSAIKQEIFGQDEAVERLVVSFSRHVKKVNNVQNKEKMLPGSAFLLGDMGTGKTSLAKTFTERLPQSELWGEWHYKFINLSLFERISTHDTEEILFEKYFSKLYIKESKNNYVFVIDEVYDASSSLFNILQQIMGEGSYVFGGQKYFFANAFFIFITNQGESLYNNNYNGVFRDNKSFPREAFRQSLLDQRTKKIFDGEEDNRMLESLIDRINDFIVLNSFNFGARKTIFKVLLERQVDYLNKLYDIDDVLWDEEFLELMAFSSAHLNSFRQIQRHFEEVFFAIIETRISEHCLIEQPIKKLTFSLENKGALSAELELLGFKRLGDFLFIDDHKPYHELLEKLGFDNMISAYSVAEGKRKLNETGINAIDWILLDLVFPPNEADGLSFLNDFRKKHKLFPVYLFSQKINSRKEFNDISKAGGAAGFIEKAAGLTEKSDPGYFNDVAKQLKNKIMHLALDNSFSKTKQLLEKKGESINYILCSEYNDGVLSFMASDLQKEPQLQIVDSKEIITRPDISFKDIKGQLSALEDIKIWINKIKTNRYTKTDKGLLLYGPPGTGKTMLAKAIANEIEAFFIAITPSHLQTKHVGESEKKVRELFDKARKHQPAVIFIDEIESIGDRSKLSGERSWEASFVNSFLAEMDGFEGNDQVFVIGATNHKDRMDKALIRPGRLSRHIYVPLPKSLEDRKEILLLYLNKALMKHNLKEEELQKLAKVTKGFSPADIMLMVDMAQDIAGKDGKDILDADCFSQARTDVLFGKISTETHERDTLKEVAIHEAGHGLVAMKLGREIYQLTVQKRDGEDEVMGFMESTPDNKIEHRQSIIDQMAISFAGREAEKLLLGRYGIGAGSDLKKAQSFAEEILKLGLTESGLPELYHSQRENPYDSTYLNNEVTEKIQSIMKEAQAHCIKILTDNKEELIELSERLRKQKTIFFYD